MNEPDDLDRYRAPALDKGLDILELLAANESGITQGEIARALGRTPNEIYRMLDRLVRRGYVARNDSDRYELTMKLYGLAHLQRPLNRLVSTAMPMMRDLAARTFQANHLAYSDRVGVFIIAQADAPGYWGLTVRTGGRIGLLSTGSGHVLLAFRSPAERQRMLAEEAETSGGLLPPDDLEIRLDLIRARGYVVMPSLQTAGVYNLSAPVFGPDGTAMAALTCPYITPLNLPNAPAIPETVEYIVDVSRRLSNAIIGISGV